MDDRLPTMGSKWTSVWPGNRGGLGSSAGNYRLASGPAIRAGAQFNTGERSHFDTAHFARVVFLIAIEVKMRSIFRWVREVVSRAWQVISPFASARSRREAEARLADTRRMRGESDALSSELTRMFSSLGGAQAMKNLVLVFTALAMFASLRWMITFLWRARRSTHDFMAWAVALSSGSLALYSAFLLMDVLFDLGRWTVHLVASVIIIAMFSAWTRILDTLFSTGGLKADREVDGK